MAELKPCPFCGKPVDSYEVAYESNHPTELTVHCDCGVRITCSSYCSRDWDISAIKLWNRRVADG